MCDHNEWRLQLFINKTDRRNEINSHICTAHFLCYYSKCVIIHSSPRKEVITVPIDASILFVALG